MALNEQKELFYGIQTSITLENNQAKTASVRSTNQTGLINQPALTSRLYKETGCIGKYHHIHRVTH